MVASASISVAPTRSEILGITWSAAVPAGADEIEEAVLRIHRDALDAAEREIRSARSDLIIEAVLARGRAASVIVDQAREMDADLVVVGHRGLGRWESMLLGSVSSEVVDHAPCPVLVARGEHLGPIILADDGSSYARTAEAVLAAWPIFTGLPVTVVTVAEDAFPYVSAVAPTLYSDTMTGYTEAVEAERRATATESEAAATRLRDGGLHATVAGPRGRPGAPGHRLRPRTRGRPIVVGTRGQTGLRRLILGSVARNIVLHAPCSVLVVREGARLDGRRLDRRAEEREVVSAFG